MEIYDPCCGSSGLLIKCQLILNAKMARTARSGYAPLRLYGQEYVAETWAMSNMNMIIHDMEGQIELGDTFKNPKFRKGNRLQTFDRVVANPMWNQDWWKEADYDADEFGRFPKDAGYPGGNADWGWVQIILASLKDKGRAAIVLDTGAVSRGVGNTITKKENDVRRWFVEQDLIEGVIYLPENLFYNTPAAGIILVLDKAKPKERRNKLFLLNATNEFTKGRPKNYLARDAVARISDTFNAWKEVEKYSRTVTHEEIAKNDFNISPNRYIHTGEADEYRPIAEILQEVETLEAETKGMEQTYKTLLKSIFGC
jgi:type I restriction enzyme M protein